MKRLQKKTIRDLFHDKYRVLMTLLAMVIGMATFGAILFTYVIIDREIDTVYNAITPSSAEISVNRADDRLIELTEGFEGISDFEVKGNYTLRLQTEDGFKSIILTAFENFDDMKINAITPVEGNFNPGNMEVLIERDALNVVEMAIGKEINISLPDASMHTLKVCGISSDITVHPASMHNVVYGYVTFDTLEALGLSPNRIDVHVSGEVYNRENILEKCNEYIKLLESNGYVVTKLEVSQTPGVSTHREEYEAILAIFQICAIVLFLFGCTIMGSLLSTMLSDQVKQIGVLKSIGAKTGNIFGAYMLSTALLTGLSFVIAVPIAAFGGGKLAVLFMKLGNMDLISTAIPTSIYLLYGAAILIVPIVTAVFPIRKGIKVSVKEALNSYGVQNKNGKTADGLLKPGLIKRLTRPVVLSLRNAMNHRSRFVMNLATLTFGGSVFVAIITCMIATQGELARSFSSVKFDYEIVSNNEVSEEQVTEAVSGIDGIEAYENWGACSGKIQYADGKLGNGYSFYGVPQDSELYEPKLMEGRWLQPGDCNEIVVGYRFFVLEPDYKLGDIVEFEVGGQPQSFRIVGTLKEVGKAVIYINKAGFDTLVPDGAKRNSIRLCTGAADLDERSAEKIYNEIEDEVRANGISIFQAESSSEHYGILTSHYMNTLLSFLLGAIMVVIVASFGLASTMSIQVAQRRKEIGIMKATGATNKHIRAIVTSESIFICISSWCLSVITGIITTFAASYILGYATIKLPLQLSAAYFVLPYAIWLVLTVVVGYMASKKAAKRAAGYRIKEALAFE